MKSHRAISLIETLILISALITSTTNEPVEEANGKSDVFMLPLKG